MVDNLDETRPEGVDVLSLNCHDFEAMALKCLGEIVSLKVFRGVTSNGDVIIVDEDFDVEVLSNCQPSGLCIVALLLRSVGTQAEDDLVTVSQGNTVDHRPHVSKASRGEFNSGSQTQLRVTRKLRVGSAVVEEVFGRDSSFEGSQQVLGSNTMT